jgi:hypothetical protein
LNKYKAKWNLSIYHYQRHGIYICKVNCETAHETTHSSQGKFRGIATLGDKVEFGSLYLCRIALGSPTAPLALVTLSSFTGSLEVHFTPVNDEPLNVFSQFLWKELVITSSKKER